MSIEHKRNKSNLSSNYIICNSETAKQIEPMIKNWVENVNKMKFPIGFYNGKPIYK